MQAAREHLPTRAVIVEFPTPMGTPPINPQSEPVPSSPPATWWQQHGTTAQWATLFVSLFALILGPATAIYFHIADASEKSKQVTADAADNHTNELIDKKLNPAVAQINANTTTQIGEVGKQVQALSEKVANLYGLAGRVADLQTQTDRQTSLARFLNPDRVLAQVRNEIQFADTSGHPLSVSLKDYRNTVLDMPTTAYAYWTTVAAIVNHQSKINQLNGTAPDPAMVSDICLGASTGITRDGQHLFSSSGNSFSNSRIADCVVDLDGQSFNGVVFENSVIRYKGGPASLHAVRFVNCNFILNLPPQTRPASPALLVALLESPDQKNVDVAATTATHN